MAEREDWPRYVAVQAPRVDVLAMVGAMPSLPLGWESLPVQQDATRPLERGHRWPLTFYPQATAEDVNAALGWSRIRPITRG